MLHRKGTGFIPTTTLAAIAFSTHVLNLFATHRKVDLLGKKQTYFQSLLPSVPAAGAGPAKPTK